MHNLLLDGSYLCGTSQNRLTNLSLRSPRRQDRGTRRILLLLLPPALDLHPQPDHFRAACSSSCCCSCQKKLLLLRLSQENEPANGRNGQHHLRMQTLLSCGHDQLHLPWLDTGRLILWAGLRYLKMLHGAAHKRHIRGTLQQQQHQNYGIIFFILGIVIIFGNVIIGGIRRVVELVVIYMHGSTDWSPMSSTLSIHKVLSKLTMYLADRTCSFQGGHSCQLSADMICQRKKSYSCWKKFHRPREGSSAGSCRKYSHCTHTLLGFRHLHLDRTETSDFYFRSDQFGSKSSMPCTYRERCHL